MTDQQLPILYSFRRCPYAMRARLAIHASSAQVELREIVLRNKPAEMIEASPKATVPVLIDLDGRVIDESFDIMNWALDQNDPGAWLTPETGDMDETGALIQQIEGPFKGHLDRYKYANRYTHENGNDGVDPVAERDAAMEILGEFEERLGSSPYLFGNRSSLADMATAPFIRQFANTDRSWFDAQKRPNLQRWLTEFLNSKIFLAIMQKYPPWKSGTKGVPFPTTS